MRNEAWRHRLRHLCGAQCCFTFLPSNYTWLLNSLLGQFYDKSVVATIPSQAYTRDYKLLQHVSGIKP